MTSGVTLAVVRPAGHVASAGRRGERVDEPTIALVEGDVHDRARRGVEVEREQPRHHPDLHVDGIVAVASMVSPEWLEQLAQRIPIVMLSRHDHSVGYDTMTGDDVAGTALAMEHLFSLGHDKIAHLTREEEVTAPHRGTPPSVRLTAYLDLMTRTGRAALIDVVRTTPGDTDGYRATLARLRKPDPPTAIFAVNDDLALGALHAISELGLAPSDVSVVGYDNIRLAGHPLISLTTVDQSGDELGQRAVGMLIERIDGRTTARHESTTPRLHVRRSTAAPR